MDNMPLDLDISELLSMDIHEWDNLRNTPLPYCFPDEEFEKEIEESEKSRWAEDNDVNTFIIKWKNLK
jgi:hypothetical protein